MNPKKIWIGIGVCLVALSVLGASIVWYNDASIPQKTVFDGSEVLSVQQTGPNAYRWSLLSDIREYTGGSSGDPVTIIYVTTLNVTTNYTTNAFITTLTVVSNAYFNSTQFVNYSIVTNLTVVSNLTVLQTNFNNYSVSTNVTIEQNLTVKGNTTITNVYFLTARPNDIAWTGPTNTLNFDSGALQRYSTFTPIAVTNVVGATNGYGNSTLLCISNAAGSNVTFTAPSGWMVGANDSTTITNGKIAEFWFLEATGRKTLAIKAFH